ncbi:TPA: hypothetical protein JG904_002670 [Enterobacter hormaechei subsp. xiangfangensis]|nr:hypothetical protein [Enterobacter hormaechei subsp. xiangfangensis]
MVGLALCMLISLLVPLFFLLRAPKRTTLRKIRPAFGSVVALLVVTGLLYWKTTAIDEIKDWRQVSKEAPALLSQNGPLSNLQQHNVALALRTRLQEEPDNARAWELLGQMQQTLNNPSEALAALHRAWMLMPSDINIALNYSVALIQSGEKLRIEKAVQILSTLDARYPGNTAIMSQLAYAALSEQDFRLAALWFRRIMSQLPASDARREFIQAMLNTLELHKRGNT